MKKIVALGCAAALVGGLAFADVPAANLSVTTFDGNASVEWGVDLDAGKTGFKNAEEAHLKVRLFDAGDKTTEGSDVWAELKIKVDADESEDAVSVKAASVDVAKIHIGDFYVGVRSGDTVVGSYSLDTAIRAEQTAVGDKGPADFTQGIVVGYGNSDFGIDVDFRSLDKDKYGQYTNSYAIAAEAQLKDSNSFVEGLAVKAGVAYNLGNKYYTDSKAETAAAEKFFSKDYDFSKYGVPKFTATKVDTLGYSASVGYKAKIDDTYYVKPMAGLSGTVIKGEVADETVQESSIDAVASVLFGWGDKADANAGVPFLDGDPAKKVTPGVSVAVVLPIATKYTVAKDDLTVHAKEIVKIIPSFYSGTIVENLKAAAYAEIILLNEADATSDGKEVWLGVGKDDDKTAMALAAGLTYDIKSDDITATVKAGMRYANACYAVNEYNKDIFADLGAVEKAAEDDYFNLKAGVDVNGLINNTTFYANYASCNLLNNSDYGDADMYSVKLGTLAVGCKLHF